MNSVKHNMPFTMIVVCLLITTLGTALSIAGYQCQEYKRLLNTANAQLQLVVDGFHKTHTNKIIMP